MISASVTVVEIWFRSAFSMVPTGHRKLEKVGEFDWPEKVMENPDVYRQSGEKSWKMKIDTDNLDKDCLATDLGFSPDNIIRSERFRKKNCSERDMLGFRTNVKISAYSHVQEAGSENASKY